MGQGILRVFAACRGCSGGASARESGAAVPLHCPPACGHGTIGADRPGLVRYTLKSPYCVSQVVAHDLVQPRCSGIPRLVDPGSELHTNRPAGGRGSGESRRGPCPSTPARCGRGEVSPPGAGLDGSPGARGARSGRGPRQDHCSAVCTPTRYGLLTGRYAWRTRLTSGVLWGESAPLVETGRLTLASLLKSRRYATAAVGKWHLGLGWPTARSAAEGDDEADEADAVRHAQGESHVGDEDER